MALKNFWSLNIDELLVADKLKNLLHAKDFEIFMPLNRQFKNIDLVLLNLKTYKATTIQVKGSRTYEPKASEVEKYGSGSSTWFRIHEKSIFSPDNKVDFYIFVLHSLVDGNNRKEIQIDYLIMCTSDFQKITKQKQKRRGGYYHYFIWIDSQGRRSFEFNNKNSKTIHLTKYLNNWKLLQ